MSRDPISENARKRAAARRVGDGKCSQCGESRPEALIAGSVPLICAACKRVQLSKSPFDLHHVAGAANDPLTVAVPVNDHRAELSTDQYLWPKQTLENPQGSPLLASSARKRGFRRTVLYLIDELLSNDAERLEQLDAKLTGKFGPKWWERL
jgi:hypothetical protein